MPNLSQILVQAFVLLSISIQLITGIFENAPGIAMDYKVHVDAGKEDCYYQYVHPGSTLYVAFQVLRGGDGQAGKCSHLFRVLLVLIAKFNRRICRETSKRSNRPSICLESAV